MAETSSRRYLDAGLLVLRVGVGVAFILHGWPKITGSVDDWEAWGQSMAHFGIGFAPAFWGFMAAIAEFVGGIALVIGFAVRPFALLMLITMIVTTVTVVKGAVAEGDPITFELWSTPATFAAVFLSLVFSGPGRANILQLFKRGQKAEPEA